MKYIKHFEGETKKYLKSTYDNSKDDFEIGKKDVIKILTNLLEVYGDFTNDVSPKYWRTTGHHITEIKNMIEDLERFEPISIEEKQLDWVKDSRFKKDD